ncbi:MAG TPA: hypothetical protein VGL97_05185 [Bryobacteraceae bacterium]|jgi:hypothetical protein
MLLSLGVLEIPAAAKAATVPISGMIPANAVVRMDLIAVGTTFPDAGLTVIVRYQAAANSSLKTKT